MSRTRAFEFLSLLTLALASQNTGAQTIAEFSAAQRAALQAEMAKALKPALAAASAPESAAPLPKAPAPAPVLRTSEALPEIAGVVLMRGRAWIEVAVAGRSHWLEVGATIPGTPWQLKSATATEVVLARQSRHATDERRVVRLDVWHPSL